MKTKKTEQFAVEIYGAEDFCIAPLHDVSKREFERYLTNASREYLAAKERESETYIDWREHTEEGEHYSIWTATIIINTAALYLYRFVAEDGYVFTKSISKLVNKID